MRKVSPYLAALLVVALLTILFSSCTESRAEVDYPARIGRVETSITGRMELIEGPDKHHYIIWAEHERGGVVHSAGCPQIHQ